MSAFYLSKKKFLYFSKEYEIMVLQIIYTWVLISDGQSHRHGQPVEPQTS